MFCLYKVCTFTVRLWHSLSTPFQVYFDKPMFLVIPGARLSSPQAPDHFKLFMADVFRESLNSFDSKKWQKVYASEKIASVNCGY